MGSWMFNKQKMQKLHSDVLFNRAQFEPSQKNKPKTITFFKRRGNNRSSHSVQYLAMISSRDK